MCSERKYDTGIPVSTCIDCGASVDKDGIAVDCCEFSAEICEKCGHSPCDESC